MKDLKGYLKIREMQLKYKDPTISIFEGTELLMGENDDRTIKRQIWVKLYQGFRDKQLAQLKGAKLGVFICLALHSNREGQCWPSVSLIAKETDYNDDTIFKALNSLVLMGYISRLKRKDEITKKLKTNMYQLFPMAYWIAKGRQKSKEAISEKTLKAKSLQGKSPV